MVTSGGPDIVNDGLVLHLDAADRKSYSGSGSTVYDLSGNNNNGTLVSSPSYSTSNKGYFTFSSSVNDYIQCANSTTLDITNSITMESWIYPTSYETVYGGMIITKLTYYFELDKTGVLRLYFYDLSSAGYHYGNAVIPLNSWSHVVGIRDKNDSSLSMYINGVLDKKVTSITGNIRSNTAQSVKIGSWHGNLDYKFAGNIALSRIYNRALSEEEILQNYNATKGRYGL